MIEWITTSTGREQFPSPYGEEVLKAGIVTFYNRNNRTAAFPSPYGEEVLKVDARDVLRELFAEVSVPLRGRGFESGNS